MIDFARLRELLEAKGFRCTPAQEVTGTPNSLIVVKDLPFCVLERAGVVYVFSLLDDTPPPRELMEALLSPEVYRA
ncbi:hypothetical protein CSW23_05350 [Thermus scotoductus]|uniref:Uncharacterized protein n=1 Tax=Thermus scotoductus TaxID=37636 RepID=A0A430V4U7_THESC|nr:hypothetical protein [Thermus scotoductus]RTH99811.1 hypothetical protein CSW31_07125 [Thermus scotoductus]RTI18106.1 hypothetical protein CSW23_05350 [Thermus scotoductus]